MFSLHSNSKLVNRLTTLGGAKQKMQSSKLYFLCCYMCASCVEPKHRDQGIGENSWVCLHGYMYNGFNIYMYVQDIKSRHVLRNYLPTHRQIPGSLVNMLFACAPENTNDRNPLGKGFATQQRGESERWFLSCIFKRSALRRAAFCSVQCRARWSTYAKCQKGFV